MPCVTPPSLNKLPRRHSASVFLLLLFLCGGSLAQVPSALSVTDSPSDPAISAHHLRAERFLRGRLPADDENAAQAISAARAESATVQSNGRVSPRAVSGLSTAWQPVGPGRVSTAAYGIVTGRITSIVVDPADTTGNTVYLGSTGGGVWKSTNAAGDAASVTFTPLTDTLPAFSGSDGTFVVPSLSIGALSIQGGVILAGTGDPNDASDSYYGSGLLRSTDGGLTWTLIQGSHDGITGNHFFVGLSFAGFAWSTVSPRLVVAAISHSTEGDLVNAQYATSSVKGLYYSTDAGLTWQMSTIMDGSQTVQAPLPSTSRQAGNAVTSVVWNPLRQRFYAAVRYHGYYESTDGATWTRLSRQPGTGLTTGNCPATAASADLTKCPIFRGVLAIQPSTGDTFALTVANGNLDQGLWQDICNSSGSACLNTSISFGKQLVATPLEVGGGSTAISAADYNLALSAVPNVSNGTADTLLFVGTNDLYRCSVAGGCALRNTTNSANGCAAPAGVAPAQHAVATFAAAAQPLVYLGNDGGLWRSTDGVNQQASACSADDASHFQNLNASLGSLAEVTNFAQDPTDPGILLAGLGALGTAGSSSAASSSTWSQLATGEGGNVAIDPSSPQLWYISSGSGVSLHACGRGSACTASDFVGQETIGAAQVGGDNSLTPAPWILDPALPSSLLVGTCRAWRGPAATGSSWSASNALSRIFGGPQNVTCDSTNGLVRSVAAGGPNSSSPSTQNAGSQVLYAGLAGVSDGGLASGGHIFATAAANTASSSSTWTDLAQSTVSNDFANSGRFNPVGFDISSIAVDSHDATGKTVYATVMGFSGNTVGSPHLYRSVDGGARWTNISSNLPNAPASSVVVDPNDANTLYVALDTGVYVTTQVSNCTSVNCWTLYGTSLPNAPITQLAAATSMPTGDGRMGELRAATYGRGIWQIPLLSAATPAQPAMSLSPAALTFAGHAVATPGSTQTITVTNSGNAPLLVTSIAATGDFSETDNCVTGLSLVIQATCAVQVRFVPTLVGARSGTLTIYGNVAGGQITAALSGTGTPGAAIVVNPVLTSFVTTTVNSTSAAKNITFSNTGAASATLQTPMITGDFRISVNTCGASLAANTGCTIAVTFNPTDSGVRQGTLSVASSVGTLSAALQGTGSAPATDALSALSLTFAAQQLNTGSTAQSITLTNSGDAALGVITAQVASGDFSVVNSCGASLSAHSACSLLVSFQPKNVGSLVGVLTVSDQYRSQTIALSGTGVAPPGVSLSPVSTVSYAALGIGLVSAPQAVTLTNNGGLPLAIQSVITTGDFVIAPGGSCGSTLAVGSACTLPVSFTPSAGGTRLGTMVVTDNAPSSPHALSLTGIGINFDFSPTASTSLTIMRGKNAVFPLLVKSDPSLSGTIALACAGTPPGATCVMTPGSVALGDETLVLVTVNTATIPPTAALRGIAMGRPLLWVAGLLPFGLLARCRVRFRGRLLCLALLAMMSFGGCGVGRQIPPDGSAAGAAASSTPVGSYAMTVSASSAGLTRTVNLNLTVQ